MNQLSKSSDARSYLVMTLSLVVGLAVLASVAYAQQPDIVQTDCPVMEGNSIVSTINTTYQGKKVYFCCLMCKATFEANPKKYLPLLPQFAVAAQPPSPSEQIDDGHGDHEHGDSHETAAAESHELPKLVRFLGGFHPVVVHFPIALIMAAALAEFLGLLSKKSFFLSAARYSIFIGAIAAVVATAMGLVEGAGGTSQPLNLHRIQGMLACMLAVVSAVLCEISHRRSDTTARLAYRVTLCLAVILIALTGYTGGILVYGPGHFAW